MTAPLCFVDTETDGVHPGRKPWEVALIRREHERRPKVRPWLRAFVLNRNGHRCVRCGIAEDLQMDHIRPWSLGGPTTLENLQALCGPCNRAKGARVDA